MSGEKHRILIAEDSAAVRAFVQAVLEGRGDCVVRQATSGFEALRLLPRETYDVVIVDINMPDINGLELVSFMRQSDDHRDTPIVIISTEATDQDRERGLSLGANAFLAKPFSPEDLEKVVLEATTG